MEFHHLGSHCDVPACKQLDFLPFTCAGCNGTFCLDHRTYESHQCTKGRVEDRRAIVCPICNVPLVALPTENPNVVLDDHINRGCSVKKSTGYKCNMQGCKKVDVVPFPCKLCRRHHCLRHRFESDHNCPRKSQKPQPKPSTNPPKPVTQSKPPSNPPRPNPQYKPPTSTSNPTNSPTSSNVNSVNNRNINNSYNNNNNNSNSNNSQNYLGNVQRQAPPISTNNHNSNFNNNQNYPGNVQRQAPPISTNNYYNSRPNNNSDATISVRLTNGDVMRNNFQSSTTLREVQLYIDQNRSDGSAPYIMRTTYPPRDFSYQDLDLSLAQLGLVPSGMIIVQHLQYDGSGWSAPPPNRDPANNNNNNNDDSNNGNNVGWWGTVSSFFTSFIPSSS